MMLETTKNIAVSALDPKKAGVMAKKVMARFFGTRGSISPEENRAWLSERATSAADWLSPQDEKLWEEAQARAKTYVETDVERIRGQYPEAIHFPGGAYAMLYFLIRKHQPEYVVETGVSLGCSSHAILTAMEENGRGELHSSDFPYFRIKDAEKYVGFVVPENLRARWSLYLDGDAKNLPEILAKVPQVDFFHYDSDKSYDGRALAHRLVKPKMAKGAMMLFDDAHDNPHFHDLVKAEKLEERTRVIDYKGKFIGVIEGSSK